MSLGLWPEEMTVGKLKKLLEGVSGEKKLVFKTNQEDQPEIELNRILAISFTEKVTIDLLV